MLPSYHEKISYEPKTYELVRQLAVRSIEKLDTTNCELDWNYYWNKKYFAFWMDCKEKFWLKEMSIKKIVVVDIDNMSFERFSETQFF